MAAFTSRTSSRRRRHPCGIALDKVAGELELDGQRQQPLLGTVVQIPLDTPAFLVGRRHDAAARSLELSSEERSSVSSRWFWSAIWAKPSATSVITGASASAASWIKAAVARRRSRSPWSNT